MRAHTATVSSIVNANAFAIQPNVHTSAEAHVDVDDGLARCR